MTQDYICDVVLSVLGLAVAGQLVGLALRLMIRPRPRREP